MSNYYTLIWKDLNNNGAVNFKMFIDFEKLRIYVKEYIRGGKIKNTKAIDQDKTIYYCEVEEDERL